MGMKQFVFLILLLPIISLANTKLPTKISDEIKSFALFNYDNLIADGYETEKPYIRQLANILNEATGVSTSIFFQTLTNEELINESNPVKYMLLLNKKTIAVSNYYFADD
ncbi:MAG: hypothetical protein PHF25_06710 [Candidatus Margulisbacteria bacterium]|nr:hypothetical protein [Candidatus Margulisiibacteriota bacterium]